MADKEIPRPHGIEGPATTEPRRWRIFSGCSSSLR